MKVQKFTLYKFGVVTILLICILSSTYATVIYVDKQAMGSNNGSSWGNAYTSLQSALSVAGTGDTIAVAAGVYTPDASLRTESFVLKEGVVLLGGFSGVEPAINKTTMDARKLEENMTILSGDLSGNDNGFSNNDENSYHVLFAECLSTNITVSTVVDGFTISGGNANLNTSPYDELKGAGIFLKASSLTNVKCNPTFRNIVVENNSAQFGGGISIISLNQGAKCNPIFENFIVRDNRTFETDNTQVGSGAGIAVTSIDGESNPSFTNGQILRNIVTPGNYDGTGGGVQISARYFSASTACNPIFLDILMCKNEASGGGSQIHAQAEQTGSEASPKFTNITITGTSSNIPVYFRSVGGVGAVCLPEFENAIISTSSLTSIKNSPVPSSSGPNPKFHYSNIKGSNYLGGWLSTYGTDNGNNMDTPTLFFDTSKCDVRIYDNSPEIGTGNQAYGNNIGYYQGDGLIYADIGNAPDITGCGGKLQYNLYFKLKDDEVDSINYKLMLGEGGILTLNNIEDTVYADTLGLTLTVAQSLYGKDTITIAISNYENEYDTSKVLINLDKSPYLEKLHLGVFNLSDSTFNVYAEPDTTMINEVFWFDGQGGTTSNYRSGMKAGEHWALTENNGCFSDTLKYTVPAYINDKKLEIKHFEDSNKVILCETDTTIYLEFKIVDDSLDQVDWLFNYHYLKAIPDSNITLSETDTSYKFKVVVPDTTGFYDLHIHAENIFGELANLYYKIYMQGKPVVDSVRVEQQFEDTYCAQAIVSNAEYSYLLKLYIDSVSVSQASPYCDLTPGNHYVYAIYDGCVSDFYPFKIEEATDTSGNGQNNLSIVGSNKFEIYPIPVRDYLLVSGLIGNPHIEIIGLDGKTVFQQESVSADLTKIDVSGLKPGVYFVRIKTYLGTNSRAFLKE